MKLCSYLLTNTSTYFVNIKCKTVRGEGKACKITNQVLINKACKIAKPSSVKANYKNASSGKYLTRFLNEFYAFLLH